MFRSPRFLYFSLLRPELSYFCPTTETIDLSTKFLAPSKEHMNEKKRATWLFHSLISYSLSFQTTVLTMWESKPCNSPFPRSLTTYTGSLKHLTSCAWSHVSAWVRRQLQGERTCLSAQGELVDDPQLVSGRWGPRMGKLTLAVFSPALQTNRFNAPLHHFTLN